MAADSIMTVYVMAGGDYFQVVMNAVAAFLKQDGFFSLLRMGALLGIIMASAGFLKSRDPMIYGRWFLAYMFFINIILLPKTNILINDIYAQKNYKVDNVPVVLALGAHLMTGLGYGLASSYDMLLAMPDSLQYTKTGTLFGSRLVNATQSFRIIDPALKEEMNQYFRSCVVGDIRLNQKYSLGELAHTSKIWELISAEASPLRMTKVNGKLVTCQEAAKKDGKYSLRKKLDAEIRSAYTFFGVKLFGKPKDKSTTYENLFQTHLTSAFNYYQHMSDSASDIFLQSMMMNAMADGISGYQAFTDSTGAIINQQMSKSQVQHRWSWEVLGQKALWILPLLHTLLTLLLFGVFPLVLVLATLPSGTRIIIGYMQFFLSLQFWPVLFAVLNAAMTLYGKSSGEYAFNMVNIDKIDELHADISGVASYLMMLIPFLAKGLVSNLGEAFSGLSTGMMSHMQGSSMNVAGEAASGSFALGQTSFYNANANNFSANKHDANWTHMAGMRTEQMGTGVLKTQTASGQTVFDVSQGMTKGAIHIADSDSMVGSLNEAYDSSKQAASNASQHMQASLSNFAHHAVQFSKQAGQDVRMGEGVSTGESAQASQAASTVTQIAEDAAKRHGISAEDALAHMTNLGWGMNGSIKSDKSAVGKLAQYISGASASVEAHTRFNRTATGTDRENTAYDDGESIRKAQDFTNSMNFIKNYATSKHADDSHSNSASLMNQMGADLRETQTASQNHDASLSRAERISEARSFVQSHSAQVSADLNQAFPAYVASRVGEAGRDQLFGNPGDLQALQKLQSLGRDFVADKREALIVNYGTQGKTGAVDVFYQKEAGQIKAQEAETKSAYARDSQVVTQKTQNLNLGVDESRRKELQQDVRSGINLHENVVQRKETNAHQEFGEKKMSFKNESVDTRYQATNGIIPYHAVDNMLEAAHIKTPKKED